MTHAGFIQAICENPSDDSPRLIYADWLEENGQEDYAEFIRIQCRIAQLSKSPSPANDCNCHRCTERKECQDRERGLAGYHVKKSEVCLPGFWMYELEGKPHHTWTYTTDKERTRLPVGQATVARGFVSAVSLPLSSWLQHGPEIVQRQPIEKVTFSDKAPRRLTSLDTYQAMVAFAFRFTNARFVRSARHGEIDVIPFEFYCTPRLPVSPGMMGHAAGDIWATEYWPSESHALADVSAAAIAWARKKAGISVSSACGQHV